MREWRMCKELQLKYKAFFSFVKKKRDKLKLKISEFSVSLMLHPNSIKVSALPLLSHLSSLSVHPDRASLLPHNLPPAFLH